VLLSLIMRNGGQGADVGRNNVQSYFRRKYILMMHNHVCNTVCPDSLVTCDMEVYMHLTTVFIGK
jgi:hypothetical protein